MSQLNPEKINEIFEEVMQRPFKEDEEDKFRDFSVNYFNKQKNGALIKDSIDSILDMEGMDDFSESELKDLLKEYKKSVVSLSELEQACNYCQQNVSGYKKRQKLRNVLAKYGFRGASGGLKKVDNGNVTYIIPASINKDFLPDKTYVFKMSYEDSKELNWMIRKGELYGKKFGKALIGSIALLVGSSVAMIYCTITRDYSTKSLLIPFLAGSIGSLPFGAWFHKRELKKTKKNISELEQKFLSNKSEYNIKVSDKPYDFDVLKQALID